MAVAIPSRRCAPRSLHGFTEQCCSGLEDNRVSGAAARNSLVTSGSCSSCARYCGPYEDCSCQKNLGTVLKLLVACLEGNYSGYLTDKIWPSGGMADATDLKSVGGQPPCGFDSRLGHLSSWNPTSVILFASDSDLRLCAPTNRSRFYRTVSIPG